MKRLLCIGDSNTYGYDPRSFFGGRYPESVRWTGRLKAEGFDVINHGENGAVIPPQSERLIRQINQAVGIDLVIIMLGTNDLLCGESAEQTAGRMERLLWDLHLHTDCRRMLISPPHLKRGEWVETEHMIEESKQLGPLYRQAAQLRDAYYADAADWNVGLLFDGVHFSEEGHHAFAKGLSEKIQSLG